eukprot:GFUD01024745.1.p1 GENE.GFUD01024745.1~~GFUD01024745.1.p1  ORF type:complete len:198 (+),score=38.92 GFUD01024745.1:79-672(+)
MAPAEDAGGLFGWKNWTLPDKYTAVERDRTPRSPQSGAFDEKDLNGDNMSGKHSFLPTDQYNPVMHPQLTIADHLLRVWQPFLKNFFTDMGANISSSQGQMCGDFELRAMECIEYYGSKQGITACKDWYDDFIECQTGAKQKLRMRAMFKKRHFDNHLEYLQGKRTWSETYEAPPKYHAYVEPWYDEKYAHMEQAPI